MPASDINPKSPTDWLGLGGLERINRQIVVVKRTKTKFQLYLESRCGIEDYSAYLIKPINGLSFLDCEVSKEALTKLSQINELETDPITIMEKQRQDEDVASLVLINYHIGGH